MVNEDAPPMPSAIPLICSVSSMSKMANLIEEEPAFKTSIFDFSLAIFGSPRRVFVNCVNRLQRLLHIPAVHQPHGLELGLRSRFESFIIQSFYPYASRSVLIMICTLSGFASG